MRGRVDLVSFLGSVQPLMGLRVRADPSSGMALRGSQEMRVQYRVSVTTWQALAAGAGLEGNCALSCRDRCLM